MASINVDLNYFGHIKTMRLVSRLGPGSDVLPIKLWCHVGKFAASKGSLAMLEAELEHVCGWWGEKGALAKALVDCGFVTREGDTWFVHDWIVHSGHLAYFQERAIKAAQKRWGKKRKVSNASSNAKTPLKQCPSSSLHSSTLLSISKFIAPTPQEASDYAKTINFKLDGEAFVSFYQARGWKFKTGQPMKDWKAAIRYWKSKREEEHGTNNSPSPTDYAALARAKREAEKARTVTSPRAISDGVRDMPKLQPETESGQ